MQCWRVDQSINQSTNHSITSTYRQSTDPLPNRLINQLPATAHSGDSSRCRRSAQNATCQTFTARTTYRNTHTMMLPNNSAYVEAPKLHGAATRCARRHKANFSDAHTRQTSNARETHMKPIQHLVNRSNVAWVVSERRECNGTSTHKHDT